jgi:hypothetical protein
MARVERLLTCGVIRDIDDFHDFWGDSSYHHFQALPQGDLRSPTHTFIRSILA